MSGWVQTADGRNVDMIWIDEKGWHEAVTETLHDELGPYGTTIEQLKAYVQERSKEREAEGWQLTHIDYRKELHPRTGTYRYIAYPTYMRTEGAK